MLVVCNGMMRSGSTLQYNLARNLVEKMGCGMGKGFFTSKELTRFENKFSQWADDKNHYVIKIHELHPSIAEMATQGSARILYIHRDIRDVAASTKRKFGLREIELVAALDRAIATCCRIERVQGVLWQRYEDVKDDLLTAIQAQADFLSLSPGQDLMRTLANECAPESAQEVAKGLQESFGFKAKSLLRRLGLPIYAYDSRTLLHADHLSKQAGTIGAWRTELPEWEADFITQRYRWWLEEKGYLSQCT